MPTERATLAVVDGAAYATQVYLTGDEPEDLRQATLAALPPGYPSVAAMLTADPVMVAHRGGSADWTEMTLRAYTNATAWGAGALEVSVNRTSDGVWFGLHDQTLDRTSGTTGADPSAMTWEQVDDHLVFGTEPYMTWAELVAAYAGTHVLLVDPKYRQSDHRAEFLDMCDQAGGPRRIVVKYSGSNTSLAAAATARGYTTWGYYYESDYTSGVLADTQAAWTLLGMDHAASTAAWEAVVGYGKPVLGHVITTPAEAATALAHGAAGLMVAAVTDVVPPALPWVA